MRLGIEIAGVVQLTAGLCFGMPRLVARGLRLQGVQAQLATMGLRLAAALALVVALAAIAGERRVALIFTVGATYFAATAIDGVRKFRNREKSGCPTR